MEEMDNDNSEEEGDGGAYETCESESDTNSSNELQEFLFRLSLALCKECPIDDQPSSTFLVYFSGILGFVTSSKAFLLARSYLSALIYIQWFLFFEQALPLNVYPTLGIDCRPRTR